MSLGQLGKTDNIFVVYPSFAGGNHLVNLIALCDKVEPSWLNGKDLLARYKGRNKDNAGIEEGGLIAHYNMPDNTHANERRLFNHLDDLKKQNEDGYINLIQGHRHSYTTIAHSFIHWSPELFDDINNIKWLMIEYPTDKDSLCARRIQIEKEHVELLEDESSLYPKLEDTFTWDSTLFEKESSIKLQRLHELYDMQPGTNSVSINSDIFFSYEGCNLLRSTLKGYFNLELPEIADEVHSEWVDMIKRRVRYYDKHKK